MFELECHYIPIINTFYLSWIWLIYPGKGSFNFPQILSGLVQKGAAFQGFFRPDNLGKKCQKKFHRIGLSPSLKCLFSNSILFSIYNRWQKKENIIQFWNLQPNRLFTTWRDLGIRNPFEQRKGNICQFFSKPLFSFTYFYIIVFLFNILLYFLKSRDWNTEWITKF